MNLPRFMEYLNAKGKMTEKPVVAQIADKLEVEPTAKNKKVKGKHDQVKEYLDDKGSIIEKPSEEGPSPNDPPKTVKPLNKVAEPGEGLGDKGDPKLVYEPDVSKGNSPDMPGGKTVKTQTESFLEKTRGMTTQEFTQYMRTQINPVVSENVRNIVSLTESDANTIHKLVAELKRAGKLDNLIDSVLSHNESFNAIVKAIKEDESQSRCKQLMNALSEMVGPPPVGMDDIDSGEDPHDPMGKKKLGDEEDEFADDSEEMDDDGMDFGHGDEDMPEDEMGDESEGEGAEDEEMGMGDEMGPPDEEMGPPPEKNPFVPKKFMGRY